MTDLESWIKYGDEMRRPLIINPDLANSSKVVIVGGGLSGMTCAYRLSQKRPDLEIILLEKKDFLGGVISCLLYTSPSPRDVEESRMPSSA